MQKTIYYLPGRGGRLDAGLGQHLLERGYDVTGRATVDEFNRLSFAEHEFRFFGNVKYGTDITLDELKSHYNAVIFSTGAIKDAELKIDSATANLGPTGIDLTTQVAATLNDSVSVSALTSFEQEEKQSLVISGNTGKIEFPQGQAFTSWKEASSIQIGEHVENFAPVDPFTLMIEAVGNRIGGESVWLPSLRESLWVMDMLDRIKAFSR